MEKYVTSLSLSLSLFLFLIFQGERKVSSQEGTKKLSSKYIPFVYILLKGQKKILKIFRVRYAASNTKICSLVRIENKSLHSHPWFISLLYPCVFLCLVVLYKFQSNFRGATDIF